MKKKSTIIIVAIIAVIIILILAIVSGYNGLVEKSEAVEDARSSISTQLQRRADLIPNFVSTVKGYSNYEQETYTAVTQARSAVQNASTVSEQQRAASQLDGAISVWVNAVTEAYPELKANEQYRALQDELAGTENRIATARRDYNNSAKSYNVSVRRFPNSIIAGIFGFDKADYFEADSSSSSVPEVSFD
ncbi:MAG: LemA family protein [Clostridia bacterium]|nr:LemA family protein [Clostridia bacterium]